MTRAIGFLCVAMPHARVKLTRGSHTLTIYKGEWAVCAAGAEDGHSWQDANGISYDALFDSPIEKDAD